MTINGLRKLPPPNEALVDQSGGVSRTWYDWFLDLADRSGQMLKRFGTGPSTVATLPSATAMGAGARAFVTDANATTFASIVAAGGANGVPVYSDGTNWRIG
jgi:hypothetical protein